MVFIGMELERINHPVNVWRDEKELETETKREYKDYTLGHSKIKTLGRKKVSVKQGK